MWDLAFLQRLKAALSEEEGKIFLAWLRGYHEGRIAAGRRSQAELARYGELPPPPPGEVN
ncbi:MAG: hypothetical protein ACWGSD_03850 [Thermodesulfobacteriota bacterium]